MAKESPISIVELTTSIYIHARGRATAVVESSCTRGLCPYGDSEIHSAQVSPVAAALCAPHCFAIRECAGPLLEG